MITTMMETKISILLIEDNPGDSRLIMEMLSEKDMFTSDLQCRTRLSQGLEQLDSQRADVILLDLGLPDSRGLEALRKLRARAPEIPVVVLTGLDDESIALEAVREGAQDYLVKGSINGKVLWRVIKYAIERHSLETLLESIFHSASVGMYILREGRFILTNPKFQNLTGYSADELLGMNSQDIVFEKDREAVRYDAGEMLRFQRKTPYEFRCLCKSGEVIWVMESVATIQYKGERALLGSVTDINEKKKIDAQMLNLGKLVAVGDLAAGIAHEVNNPLTVIMGYAQLLLENPGLPANIETDLRSIYDESQRVVKIIQNLLRFARRSEPGRDLVDLNDVIARALELQRYDLMKNNVALMTTLEPGLPCILADYNQMLQVVLSVLTNAQQALKEVPKNRTLDIATAADKKFVRISVSDNGPGIAPENINRIFDPFFTTKEVGSGNGLGLSVCHGIVSQHDGKILVDSSPARGATFVIELPLPPDASDTTDDTGAKQAHIG